MPQVTFARANEDALIVRASLLGPQPAELDRNALATSDAAIRERTGLGWEEWFDRLDAWGAPGRTHREIARWVAEQQGVHPLAGNAQAVAASYERARGRPDGELRERTHLEPRSARFDRGDGSTRVHVVFVAEAQDRSTAAISHERLPDAAAAERMKAYWRERVTALKAVLEA